MSTMAIQVVRGSLRIELLAFQMFSHSTKLLELLSSKMGAKASIAQERVASLHKAVKSLQLS